MFSPRIAALAALLVGLSWSGGGLSRTPPAEGITVCPSSCAYAKVQEAIDEASPGATILIEDGIYEENLAITKSLALKGTIDGQATLKGQEKGAPVILVEGGPEGGQVVVRIEALAITAGQGYCLYWPVCADGILIRGRAQAVITGNVISHNGWGGIAIRDEAQVTIEHNLLSANRRSHISLQGSASATIQDNQILNNGDNGIVLWDSSQAAIQRNRVSGNLFGIKLRDFAQVSIAENSIAANRWDGLQLRDSAQAVITDNRIVENGKNGLQLRDSSQASIVHNQISHNQGDGVVLGRSARGTLVNNTVSYNEHGILLGWGEAQEDRSMSATPLKISANEVFGNRGWGMILYAETCGFSQAPEASNLPLRGEDNESHHNGKGNLCPPYPGSPWPEGFLRPQQAG